MSMTAQYDNDATTWSPQGRLLQVEYACEAVQQGSVCVGLRNDQAAVLLALKVLKLICYLFFVLINL